MVLFQPVALLLVPAAGAILVLAYYLRRRRAPQVLFSAVQFLPRASRTRTPRAFMPPLRLLVYLAVIGIIALSLAQPLLFREQPAPLGLVLDDSALAGGRSALSETTLAIASKVSSQTHWAVFTTSGQEVAYGVGQKNLRALLDSYRMPPERPGYSPVVFQQAAAFLKERSGATPVLLLAGNTDTVARYPDLDGQRTSLGKEGIRLLALAAQGNTEPAFIAAVGMPHLAGLGVEARARIGMANTSTEALSGELRLMSGGAVVLRTPVKLPAQSLVWQELKTAPGSRGKNGYEIVLSIAGHEDIEDKVPWELIAFERLKALVLASSGADPGYVEKALRASLLVDSVTVVEPESLDIDKLRQYLSSTKLAAMDGVDAAAFPAEFANELKTWVESGGVLFFAAGPKVSLSWSRNPLILALPAPIRAKKDTLLQGVGVVPHALTRNLEMETVPLTVSQWLPTDKPDTERVLMTVGKEPLLLIRRVKEGTVLYWASTSDPRWNNWARHPSFPAFWSNVAEYAASGDVSEVSQTPGNARALWRAASDPTSNKNEQVYFVNHKEGEPVALPPGLEDELGRPAKSHRDYHEVALATGLLLALGYLWYEGGGRRRLSR